MPNLAQSLRPGALSTYIYPAGYDQTKLGLGPCMIQANDAGNEGKWVGPQPVQVARPVETGLLVPNVMPNGIQYTGPTAVGTYSPKDQDWIVLADGAAVSATRRFTLWTFNRAATSGSWGLVGSIVVTIPSQGTQGTYTNKGHKLVLKQYTTGNASITNGTTGVTGAGGTAWSADRIFIGSRIGFPATAGDPTTVPQWYEVSAVGSDSSITLTQNFAQTTLTNASYIIEDLRIVFVMTNGVTAVNGGTFMVAGLRYENFTAGGFAIAAATTTDKVRACYWLSDGNATSNTTYQATAGCDVDAFNSWTDQSVYSLDCPAGNARIIVNNFRAAMTLTAGRTAATGAGSTFTLATGQQAVTGTVSTFDTLVLCTPGAGGGPRNGVKSLFWVTTSRVMSAAVSGVTAASTTFISGVMTENPPGTSTTYALTAAFNSLDYDSVTDRFLILTSGATSFCHYFTPYREDAGQIERLLLTNHRRTDQTTADATVAIFPQTLLTTASGCFVNGMLYYISTGTTATTNLMYNVPLGADWEYASASNARVVFPSISIAGFAQLIAAYFNVVEVVGAKSGSNLGQEPGAIRMYYRTSGISDNSGSWTLVDFTGDLSGVSVASATSIQFMFEFRAVTWVCLPGRLTRVSVEGSGSAMDPHFQASQAKSSVAAKQFAFRYSTAFGGTVPTLYLRIIDGVTGSTLVTDDSVAKANGTWEKSTDGTNWTAFNTTDRANETTYLRFTPTSIADNVNALAWIALS